MAEIRRRSLYGSDEGLQATVDGDVRTEARGDNEYKERTINSKLKPRVPSGATLQKLLIIVLAYAVLFNLVYRVLLWVPTPLGPDAPAHAFSEGRVLQTVSYLSEDIGPRMVSTPQIEDAALYVERRAKELQDLAKDTRLDLMVEVDREQTSGAVNMVFVGTHITNAYNNLTNIIVRIARREHVNSKAVLINAHFDSVFESPGASDCAACVGTALEVARVIVADPGIELQAPLMLLLNGGEETVLTAAHGFMNNSKWADQVGAFINLESTGPAGPDVLFQHTGSWTMGAYAKGAKYPHGSVFGQDLFETRLLSMDTDFRMFSSDYMGRLPGIDIAQVMDGAAYHSKHDTVDRIRKGTIQMLGENVLGATIEFAKALKEQETWELPDRDADGSVYFDLLGSKMVQYPLHIGRAMHALALPAALLAMFVLARVLKVDYDPVLAALQGALLWIAAAVSAAAVPAILGTVRVALTGKPMIWFGRIALAQAVYVPAALAGLLLPFALFPRQTLRLEPTVLGISLVNAALAAVLTFYGRKTGFAFAIWAFAGIASLLVSLKARQTWKLAWTMLTALPPLFGVAPAVLTLPQFVMEHISIGGAGKPPLGMFAADVVVGALFGLVAAMVAGHIAAWLAHTLRHSIWRVILALLLVSAAAAAYASMAEHPYSDHFPKRIFLQHLHLLGPDGKVQESRWTPATLDVYPVQPALPSSSAFLDNYDRDWQAMHPVPNLMRGVALAAPAVDSSIYQPGQMTISLTGADPVPGRNVSRLHLLMQLPWPAWGVLNVTGPLQGWSYADTIESKEYITRFSGNAGSETWPFWVDAQGDWKGKVRFELSAITFQNTTELHQFVSQLPPWTTVSAMTTLQSSFTF